MNCRIRLIVCYIGAFPVWFSLWLQSCQKNPTVDFLIVTDQLEPEIYPSNVKFIKTTLKDLEIRFQKQCDIKVVLDSPYKLCDFRPLYGRAFQEELSGYGFWGYCDIDLIWGNIRSFITENMLSEYDRIGRAGHFSIYKNTEYINNAFTLEGGVFDYKEVFQSSFCFAFDEMTGINILFRKNKIPFYEEKNYADISPSYSRIRLSTNSFPYELYYWDNGRCYRSYKKKNDIITEEFMYIHFQKRKLKNFISADEKVESFFLTKEGFHCKKTGVPSSEDIYVNNSFENERYEKNEKQQDNKRKIILLSKKSWKEKRIWIKQQMAMRKYYKK